MVGDVPFYRVPFLEKKMNFVVNLLVKSHIVINFGVSFRPRLHGIGSKWYRIHLDLIHFLRGVYTGSDPEWLAFTRDRIHFDFINTLQRSSKPFLLF